MSAALRLALPKLWRTRSPVVRLLAPLSWVYSGIIRIRRAGYESGVFRVARFSRPVVVVGGITVGGSGKTPLVMHVVRTLAERGCKPGIVSRGYGGRTRGRSLVVDRSTPVSESGDEPAMLARHLDVPIVVDADRPRGVDILITKLGCDVVVSDDGLQHYAMDRQLEIAVIGGSGYAGNGYCLPAGPLREPPARLREVDMVVCSGAPVEPGWHAMTLRLDDLRRIKGGDQRPLVELEGHRVHAVAGTGNPCRFFAMLEGLGLDVEAHPFPDHHRYEYRDFQAMSDAPIVMTEKDAVKCADMPLDDAWYAPVSVELDEGFNQRLIELLKL